MIKTYFVVCSLLLPPSGAFVVGTFVHNDIFRFGGLNLGRRRILTWDVGRVRGNLLKRGGKKRRKGGKHDCL
jgi:hypothetical protein